jgi:hypothetical protein
MTTERPTTAPLILRVANLEDAAQIRRLEEAHFGVTELLDDWRGLWLKNPLWPRLGGRWPIAWVLEDRDGRVVGSLRNIPTLYHFRGRELINAAGRAWAVDAAFRGYALWLLDEYYNQADADMFVNNTIDRLAEAPHHCYASRIPLGQWNMASYFITGYRGFAKKALQRLGVPLPGLFGPPASASLWLRDKLSAKRLPPAQRDIAYETAQNFDARFEEFWQKQLEQSPDKLLAARDLKTLTWHYAVPLRTGRLWIYTALRHGKLRAYCVFKRQDTDDGILRMLLVDYQTLENDSDLLVGMLAQAIQRCAKEKLHALELRGAGLPGLESFDRCASYRRKLPNWLYYFRAVDPALAAQLHAPGAWIPSMYDGDGSFR